MTNDTNSPATPQGPSRFQVIAIRGALKLYDQHKMKVNAAYTPTAMMRTAAHLTGKKFKPRDYKGAIAALTELLGE
jgi:hypothetical protein